MLQGVLRVNGRPAKIKLRVTSSGAPASANVEITDLMFQPGPSVSGWLPHVTEMPWVSGVTEMDSGGGGVVVRWEDVEGKPLLFPPEAHRHNIGDVTGLQEALDAKAASAHTHTVAQVSGLQPALDAKAPNGHTHAIADISSLQAALDWKAGTSHTHAVATPSTSGFMSAADKAKLDSSDLGYRKKTATDAPSTYGGGVSAGLMSKGDGWPANTDFWTVVTFGSSSFIAAKVQHLYPYNAPSVAPLYRVARTDDTWGPFAPLRGA